MACISYILTLWQHLSEDFRYTRTDLWHKRHLVCSNLLPPFSKCGSMYDRNGSFSHRKMNTVSTFQMTFSSNLSTLRCANLDESKLHRCVFNLCKRTHLGRCHMPDSGYLPVTGNRWKKAESLSLTKHSSTLFLAHRANVNTLSFFPPLHVCNDGRKSWEGVKQAWMRSSRVARPSSTGLWFAGAEHVTRHHASYWSVGRARWLAKTLVNHAPGTRITC